VNYYPDHYLSEKAYFKLGEIYKGFVSGPSYDQGSTLNALNYFEDYLILYDQPPRRGPDETISNYQQRIKESAERKKVAQTNKNKMRASLAQSKLEIGRYVENYGKYFLTHWEKLGNKPALQFYNQAITTAPESDAAREAEMRVAELRND
jgi:outer membrane protein assembly factor BamD